MVRHRKKNPDSRTYRRYSEGKVDEALLEIVEGRLSIKGASQKFNIPYGTLYNKFHGMHCRSVGAPTVLSAVEEQRIVRCVQICGDWGYALTRDDLRLVVQILLKAKGEEIPMFKDYLPGFDWLQGFMKRHEKELTVRRAGNIPHARATVDIPKLKAFFEELQKTIRDVPPDNIYNFDETAVTDDPGSSKVIFRRGVKHPCKVQNFSKSSTTVMMCGSAAGTLLPPFIIYKALYLYPTWCEVHEKLNGIYCMKDCCKHGMRFSATKTGWINPEVFDQWFFNIFLPHAQSQEGKKILIGDNLSSHFTLQVVESCLENNIQFVPLLANSTHLLQPLDVAFFRPFKVGWRKILSTYKLQRKKVKTIAKCDFPDLLHTALKQMDVVTLKHGTKVLKTVRNNIVEKRSVKVLKNRISHNLVSGFAKAGIAPFLPERVYKEIPGYKPESGDDSMPETNGQKSCSCGIVGSQEENAVVQLLKTHRFGIESGNASAETRRRNTYRGRQLEVIPGKAVSMMVQPDGEDSQDVDDPEIVTNLADSSTANQTNKKKASNRLASSTANQTKKKKASDRLASSTANQTKKKKASDQLAKRNKKRKLKENSTQESQEYFCTVCGENYERPNEKWIQCCNVNCLKWTHMDCSGADEKCAQYLCILCLV